MLGVDSGRQLNSMLSGRQSSHEAPFEERNPWILAQEKENDGGLTDLFGVCLAIESVPQPAIVSGIKWRTTHAHERSDR